MTPYVRGEPVIYLNGKPTHWLAKWRNDVDKKLKLKIDGVLIIELSIWDWLVLAGMLTADSMRRFYDNQTNLSHCGRFDLES